MDFQKWKPTQNNGAEFESIQSKLMSLIEQIPNDIL